MAPWPWPCRPPLLSPPPCKTHHPELERKTSPGSGSGEQDAWLADPVRPLAAQAPGASGSALPHLVLVLRQACCGCPRSRAGTPPAGERLPPPHAGVGPASGPRELRSRHQRERTTLGRCSPNGASSQPHPQQCPPPAQAVSGGLRPHEGVGGHRTWRRGLVPRGEAVAPALASLAVT